MIASKAITMTWYIKVTFYESSVVYVEVDSNLETCFYKLKEILDKLEPHESFVIDDHKYTAKEADTDHCHPDLKRSPYTVPLSGYDSELVRKASEEDGMSGNGMLVYFVTAGRMAN